MHKGRLEAFSDGVLAIIITIMVLELKAPHSAELSALKPLLPVLLSYILSFERQTVSGLVRGCDCGCVRPWIDRPGAVCAGGADVAGPGSAD